MSSAWIAKRVTKTGEPRYRVLYRPGRQPTTPRYAGSFRTKAEATARLRWVLGELAAMRMPDTIPMETQKPETIRQVCERWQASRIDAASGTRVQHRVALGRILPMVGNVAAAKLTPDMVAEAVTQLHAAGYARGSIQKSRDALRMALDHAGIEPNPARDRNVRLPREDREEIQPPTAEHVEAAMRYVAPRYRLPLLIVEACGLRIGELEHMRWADVDEPGERVRVRKATSKTRQSRWVQVPHALFILLVALVPREDRAPDAPVFPGATQERMRTDLTRACKAAGIPRFGLHDLRHRRLSLWHQQGVPIAEIAHRAGHRQASMTLDVYSHVMPDSREVDRALIL